MSGDLVALFGGSGFLGSAIAPRLLAAGHWVRVVTRQLKNFTGARAGLEFMAADLRDGASIARALEGATAVVNVVGLYREHRGLTFEEVHVAGARRLALAARQAGLSDLTHMSGLGVDIASRSTYLQARAEGEAVVREAFPDAVILRPSAIFGPDAGLVTSLAAMLRWAPVFPLFGDGSAWLQPVALGDVAAAAAGALADPKARGRIFELGGPKLYSYRELLELLLRAMGKKCHLPPLSYGTWELLAGLLSPLPNPPVTLAQVVLMRHDNVVSAGAGTLEDLGVQPTALEDKLAEMIRSR